MDYKVRDPEGTAARGGGTLSSIMHMPTMQHLIYILVLIGLCHSNKRLNSSEVPAKTYNVYLSLPCLKLSLLATFVLYKKYGHNTDLPLYIVSVTVRYRAAESKDAYGLLHVYSCMYIVTSTTLALKESQEYCCYVLLKLIITHSHWPITLTSPGIISAWGRSVFQL
jgi:hypothetical protein